ncbi:MerR family transcriptional regulator [Nocardia sp. CA-151230]|uniref:MerR family transcriptional regulator n=1 Tax=Nocardia sp. CA-151230 TaxID=3239982 RepID=UPI003D8B1583
MSSTGRLAHKLGLATFPENRRQTVLTIGQLAATARVTVRTIRHYHQVGLLPEPARDASGYRRYNAQTAVDLVRIRTLADAGVPLARIDALLHAQPTEFAAAITDIDTALQAKIDRLTEHRRRIAELASGEELVLPPRDGRHTEPAAQSRSQRTDGPTRARLVDPDAGIGPARGAAVDTGQERRLRGPGEDAPVSRM